ncbi:hypothetical protein B0T11DRAFT_355404 [Plectosphaerella cucumerina]|jgi:hypothetical protein|uniref:Uncharacterized protein n=1 Tax=Plectosphaerella cucumerina TaxID=40658 RepID=A0A8K0THT5_9PEZI|nr:hypothetical protein B0T11DRAFT_355404 [Plectosphaerella cucumerina]
MRSAAIITSVLVTSAVALVTPRAEEDSPFIIQSFDVPGASEELGITVPKGAPEGLFSVTIGADGVAHHTRIELPEGGPPDHLATRDDENDEASSVSLAKRQSGWNYVCGDGRSLNREITDMVMIWMKWYCGATTPNWRGTEIKPYEKMYGHDSGVVVYFCNFDRVVHLCKHWEMEEHLQGKVGQKCGAYKPGWATWGDYRISIGQQGVGSDMYFCGQYN